MQICEAPHSSEGSKGFLKLVVRRVVNQRRARQGKALDAHVQSAVEEALAEASAGVAETAAIGDSSAMNGVENDENYLDSFTEQKTELHIQNGFPSDRNWLTCPVLVAHDPHDYYTTYLPSKIRARQTLIFLPTSSKNLSSDPLSSNPLFLRSSHLHNQSQL